MEKIDSLALEKSLNDLVVYGKGLIANESFVNELPNYCKYLESVKKYIYENSSDSLVHKLVDSMPIIKHKGIERRSFFSIFKNYAVEREVVEYIEKVNSLSEKIIFRLKIADDK